MGNKTAAIVTNGGRNFTVTSRAEYDYYATDPNAIDSLLEYEQFSNEVWEPACGGLHISNRLTEYGYTVLCTDIVQRVPNIKVLDFLGYEPQTKNTKDIITNPPYKQAKEFVEHALEISRGGVRVAMFLKLTFLESKSRYSFFKKYPPKCLYVFSGRMGCALNGDFESQSQSAIAYAWYIWQVGYKGYPIIKWIPPKDNGRQ